MDQKLLPLDKVTYETHTAHTIGGEDPIKFFNDCQKFEYDKLASIVHYYEINSLLMIPGKVINIPGFQQQQQEVQMKQMFSKTYILRKNIDNGLQH